MSDGIQAIDLNVVSERLHVDPATMARKLQSGGREVDVDMATLDKAVCGEAFSVWENDEEEPATKQHYACTEQLRPTKPILVTPGAKASTPTMTRRRKLVRWWVVDPSTGEFRRDVNVHGTLIDRTKQEIQKIRSASGRFQSYDESTPLLPPKRTYQISRRKPAGVVGDPVTAILMPLDTHHSVLAVVEEQPPPPKASSILAPLPDEIKTIDILLKEDADHKVRMYLVLEFARPLVGWAILIVGVTCMAAVGPVIKMMSHNNVSGFIVGCWNAQGLCLMFTTAALLQGQFGRREMMYLSSRFGFILLACAGIISGLGSGCWTLSFMFTSVPQSYLFNSFHPSLIIAWRLLAGRKVLTAERAGVAMGLVGASLSVLDGGGGPNVPFGDMLAFLSSVSLCFYLLASKKARNHLPLMLNLAFVTFFSALSQSVAANYMTPGGLTFDTDPVTGLFGWYSPSHFYVWMLINIVTGIGQAGYIGALKYLNPVVVSICMTTEPATATFFAMSILGEGWPKMYTMLGGLLIIASSIVVSVFSVHSAENVELDVGADTVDLPGIGQGDEDGDRAPLSPFVLPGARRNTQSTLPSGHPNKRGSFRLGA